LPSVHDSAGVDPLSFTATTGLFPPPAILLISHKTLPKHSHSTKPAFQTQNLKPHTPSNIYRSREDLPRARPSQKRPLSTDPDTLNPRVRPQLSHSKQTQIRPSRKNKKRALSQIPSSSPLSPSANTPTTKRRKERQHEARTRAPTLQTAGSWSTHLQENGNERSVPSGLSLLPPKSSTTTKVKKGAQKKA